MRILITAGGTGGHLYPAVALIQNLKKKIPDLSILWIGGKKEWEGKIVEKEKVQFRSIDALPFPRPISLKLLNFIVKMTISIIQSLRYILSFKPELVVGMGSFHSYPVVLSAFLLGKPVVICEQNLYPSLTNRMLLPFASRIALSFPESIKYLPAWGKKKAVVTGNPVRERIINASRREAIRSLNLEEGKFTLLFLGGSQGAHYLNKVAVETLYLFQEEEDREKIQFILITGEKDYPWIRKKITENKIKGKVFPYLSDIHHALAASDLVICRSGATTISEITARGLPCILVPYPFATDQHQLTNALFLEKEGGAILITQEKLTPNLLKKTIKEIIENPGLRNKMKKASKKVGQTKATQNLVDLILKMGRN